MTIDQTRGSTIGLPPHGDCCLHTPKAHGLIELVEEHQTGFGTSTRGGSCAPSDPPTGGR
jgi:hypothetical protein